ncbi:MAG: hypothetical protein JXD22_10950 [Sedimentisphaerales bacterium]|nr:hypothetical protein [Sedimentisphaerales bacterium]
MGNINQTIFIRNNIKQLSTPCLEVGSKDYGNTQDIKALFAGKGKYVRVDMEQGPTVDVVVDFTEDFEVIDEKLQGQRFATVFCLSVMEHCANPFKMAANMSQLLTPGGKIIISAPFCWRLHAFPSDYWRFTHEGIKQLFPDVVFDMDKSFATTGKKNDFHSLSEKDYGRIFFSFDRHRKKGHFIRGISAELLKLLARIGILKWLAGHRYLMPPTNVVMIGTKK